MGNSSLLENYRVIFLRYLAAIRELSAAKTDLDDIIEFGWLYLFGRTYDDEEVAASQAFTAARAGDVLLRYGLEYTENGLLKITEFLCNYTNVLEDEADCLWDNLIQVVQEINPDESSCWFNGSQTEQREMIETLVMRRVETYERSLRQIDRAPAMPYELEVEFRARQYGLLHMVPYK